MAVPYAAGANQGTTASLTFHPSVTSAGDVLVLNAYAAAAVTAVKDTQNNQYVLVNGSGAGSGGYQWVTTGKTAALAVTDTVTVTLASSAAVNATLTGVPGAVYAPVDQVKLVTGSGTSPSVSVTPVVPGEVIIAGIGNGTGSGTTWGGGFTSLANSHGSLSQALNVAYLVTSPTVTPSAVTAPGTITSAAWTAMAVTLITTSFVGNAPVPPTQPAGTVAASADMNALALTALFLRRPPMIRATQTGTPQPLTALALTPVSWTTLQRDTDGFWSTANNTRLTVQTKGVYKIRYSLPFLAAGNNLSAWVRVTTGANNPAGAGVTSTAWYSWSGGVGSGTVNGATPGGGILPQVMYPGDYAEVIAVINATSSLVNTQQPPTVSMRLVST